MGLGQDKRPQSSATPLAVLDIAQLSKKGVDEVAKMAAARQFSTPIVTDQHRRSTIQRILLCERRGGAVLPDDVCLPAVECLMHTIHAAKVSMKS